MGSFQDVLHALRQQIDGSIKAVGALRAKPEAEMTEDEARSTREVDLAFTKLQEAKMWLGKALEAAGSQLPPEFRDEAKEA